MVGYNSEGPARDRVLRLMQDKDRIESQIRDQFEVLAANNIGMNEPLVDDQGFPRSDIDIYKVRHARHQIICLQNDHKATMRRIEHGLAEVHAQFIPNQGTSHINSSHTNGHVVNGNAGDTVSIPDHNEEGFATITVVQDGSPADLAGFQVNDEVLQFGSVNTRNFREITQVHDVVGHSINQEIRVIVRRNNQIYNLTVTPRPWGQPGLLGCLIVRKY